MLRLQPGVSHLFVKRMRFRPSDVAANGHLFEAAPARPLLYGLDQTPPHAACPSAFGYNQSANFAYSTRHEELVLHRMNPTNDVSTYLSNENDVLFAFVQSFQTALHGFTIDWVTKNAAEFCHTGCIHSSGFANNEIIHRHTLMFKSNSPGRSNFALRPC
jgi:hypothetical protein